MIPYKTFSTLFSLGPLKVEPWGLMVVIGILISLIIIIKQAKKRNLNIERVYGLFLAMLIGGILGARIGWILTESSGLSFWDYFKIWQGGVIFYGGLIGAILFFWIYAKYKRLDIAEHLDLFALAFPVGIAIGRIGCYLIGDHLGKPTILPWAILMQGQLTHPVVLYEILALILISILIFKLSKDNLPKGSLFAVFVLTYSIARFLIDFFRADPVYSGLTIAQWTSIALAVISGYFLLKNKLKIA